VERRELLDNALKRCLNSDGPYFLDVRVRAEENCFPMIPSGAGHDEVWLGEGRAFTQVQRRD
jgi:acetolactate synthase I/II/III large subunit